MPDREFDIVTGAFGYTGKYITERLLAMGKQVGTLTGHPERPNPFGNRISVSPFSFDNLPELVTVLRGASTVYNTYWVRFPYGRTTFQQAVSNSEILVKAAEEAGVRRIVHLSITNASRDSSLPYFRGKGLVEEAIIHSALSYAILRPTLIFGKEDILINNIAWLLRRFPVFAIPGAGDYRVQPVFVSDLAEIAVRAGQEQGNSIRDAVGPENYTFNEMVLLIARAIGSRARMIHLSPRLALLLSKLIGRLVSDVILTRDEVRGLMAGLLVSKSPPTGWTRLSEWLADNAGQVGTRYSSELGRHYN
jgi:NADH dehydrogenase